MPNWKKVIVSGSSATLNSLFVSTSVTASIFSGSAFTGSLFGTASWANNALTSSYILNAVSASFATNAGSASYALNAGNAQSSSFASTASSADNFTVRGTLTAQTIVVQVITSSTDFVTGSTRFGTLASNTHQFTGSVSISGSLTVQGAISGSNITGSLLGTASYANNALSSSYAVNSGNTISASFSTNAGSASYALNAGNSISSSFATNAGSASYALNAGNAISSSFATNAGSASYALNAGNTQTASFATNAANAFIQNGNSFGVAAVLGTNDSQSLQFETSGSVRVTISGSGNVGIGMTTPTGSLLHVQGNIFATSLTSSGDIIVNNYTIGRGGGSIDTNVAVGGSALLANTSGTDNIGIGSFTLANIAGGTNNIAIGSQAMSGSGTSTVGAIGIGVQALQVNVNADDYVAIGDLAHRLVTSGTRTVAIGSGVQLNTTYSFANVVIGYRAGAFFSAGGNHLGGDYNIYIGHGARPSQSYAINEIVIGASTLAGTNVGHGSNTVTLGNREIVRTILRGNIGIGTTSSLDSTLTVSGSVSITGSVNSSAGFTGSLLGTAATASFFSGTVTSASYASASTSASYAFTASFALNGNSSHLHTQSVAATTWSVVHNFQTQFPVVTVYDNTNSVIIPQQISASTTSSLTILFSSPRTGYVAVSKGGYTANVGSASYAFTSSLAILALTASFLSGSVSNATSASYSATSSYSEGFKISQAQYFATSSAISGSSRIIVLSTSSFDAVFVDYVLSSGSNQRAGTVVGTWNSGSVQFMDNSTLDIGTTSVVTMSVAISASSAVVQTQSPAGWTIKTTYRTI